MSRYLARNSDDQKRQDQLLTTLERLLAIEAVDVKTVLTQATQLVAEAFSADKADAFLHDPMSNSLVALGTSDTPMGRWQKAIGMDRLPLANRGRSVEVFLANGSYITGHADQDPEELVGIKEGLGVKSEIITVFEVNTERRGLLLVSSSRPNYFSEQDVRFLEAVAHWIGIVAHRAELVEQMTKEAVAQGRRLAAEELLTIMAHDLRNYLTPLKGHIGLMERRARREKQEQYLRDATQANATLHQLERVINDLLDVARLNQGIFSINPLPLNIVELVQELVSAFTSVETTIHCQAPQEVVISADPDRLRQALENLLANAVKHALKNTPVTLKIDTEQREDKQWVKLIISNQGSQILPDLVPHLFQPFVADSSSTGLGLGLYIANRIAEAHSGTLTVDSIAGEGVHFTLSLPMND